MKHIALAVALVAVVSEPSKASQQDEEVSVCDANGVWAYIAAESRDIGIPQRQMYQDVRDKFGGTSAYEPIRNIVEIAYQENHLSPTEIKRLTVSFCEALT